MAVAYTDVPHALALELGLSQAPDGTHFKTFTGPTVRDVNEQMDTLTKRLEAHGAHETKRSKIGRNSPCWCGSGRKFKKCCLGEATTTR